METEEGTEGGNVIVAPGLRTGVQIDQGGKKGRKDLGRWVTGGTVPICSAHQ